MGGSASYSPNRGRSRAEQNEKAKHVPDKSELPPTDEAMDVDASVLMNVKADRYVAVFGVVQDGTTVVECNEKMDATAAEFLAALKGLGIGGDDVFVDFAAQNRIYGYKVDGNLAKEDLVGFEIMKTVSIHFTDKALFDSIALAASKSKIYDLIKVDYVVKDTLAVQDRLADEAAKILQRKRSRYEGLLGTKLTGPPQVLVDKTSIYSPNDLYDSYVAFDAEDIDREQYRARFTVQGARKGRTFYFNALGPNGFDHVVDPVVEPVVQFTLYLRVKYGMEKQK
jgi:uncharacterized protein YggE